MRLIYGRLLFSLSLLLTLSCVIWYPFLSQKETPEQTEMEKCEECALTLMEGHFLFVHTSFAETLVLPVGLVLLILQAALKMFLYTKGITEKHTETQLISLYEELLVAGQREVQLSREIRTVLDNLRHLSKEQGNFTSNWTDWNAHKDHGSTSFNNMFNAWIYLPHLKDQKDSLIVNVLLGKGRTGVSLVLGIPTVKREKQSYLLNTLKSLFYGLSSEELADIVVIVFVAEVDTAYVEDVADSIKTNFPNEVKSGVLEVVSASPHFYPSFSSLKETFGDSKERVKWRTKQNLDYSFLMLYAWPKGSYYVQLEDDIVAKAGYLQTMKTFLRQQIFKDWLILEFSQLGFIGKMFRTSDLPMLVEFILMFYKDKPIDWLLDHILWVKACHPEKNSVHCNREKEVLKRRYKPSLFQHVGLHSSLRGKIQNLRDKDFGKQVLFKAHSNPPAELTTSLTAYKTHTLKRAYLGEDFFWGMSPMAGDFVQIHFYQPQAVKGYLFRSGNIETNEDKFYNTTVEVLPSDSSVLKTVDRHSSADGFILIGAFVNGVAQGTVDPLIPRISAMRLVIHSDSDVWVLLSEIFISTI